MTLALVSAFGMAIGTVSLLLGLRRRKPSIHMILSNLSNNTDRGEVVGASRSLRSWRIDRKAGVRLAPIIDQFEFVRRWLESRLALCNVSLEALCAKVIAAGLLALLTPFLVGVLAASGVIHLSIVVPMWVGLVCFVGGASVPVFAFASEAKAKRRHARQVTCTFLDLVILGLAGGMGIESALLAAAQLGESDLSRRILAALLLGRDSGEAPWAALGRLGATLGIQELEDLAATAKLAGSEGASIRASLAARASSIRRHQLSEAEADANATTERMFLPGILLLLGFLLFIGYPAFARIVSGV
ncbi:MAG: type II secretion system F family protein [Nitrososphaerales archaeon]